MRICVLHNSDDTEVCNIVDIIADKYNLNKIDLDVNDIEDTQKQLLTNYIVTSMSLCDYLKIKKYCSHIVTCYVNCSDDNEKILNDNSLWDEDLFTFRILNNKILSQEQIADMIYEATYGKELTDKQRRVLMYQVKENELLFAKTRQNAIVPSKRDEDGCYDIYACFDDDEIVIEPFRNMLVDSGIATAFDKKWRLAIRERGTNSKSGLMTMSGQVDSGYRGNIFVSLYNANRVPVIISKKVDEIEKTDNYIKFPYKKAIAQFAMEEVPVLETKEIDYEVLKTITSKRGTGALGSSGK